MFVIVSKTVFVFKNKENTKNLFDFFFFYSEKHGKHIKHEIHITITVFRKHQNDVLCIFKKYS